MDINFFFTFHMLHMLHVVKLFLVLQYAQSIWYPINEYITVNSCFRRAINIFFFVHQLFIWRECAFLRSDTDKLVHVTHCVCMSLNVYPYTQRWIYHINVPSHSLATCTMLAHYIITISCHPS